MRSKRRRVVTSTYTPAVKYKPATSQKVTPGGKVIPGSPAVQGSPSQRSTTTDEEYQSGKSPISGDPQVVMVLLFVLFVVSTWNDLTSKLVNVIWDPESKKDITGINWGRHAGMLAFIAFAVIISLTGEEAAGLMMLMTIALIIVYLVENNGGGFTQLFDSLTNMSKSA